MFYEKHGHEKANSSTRLRVKPAAPSPLQQQPLQTTFRLAFTLFFYIMSLFCCFLTFSMLDFGFLLQKFFETQAHTQTHDPTHTFPP